MPTIIASIIGGAWPLLLAVAVFAIGYGQGQDKAKADAPAGAANAAAVAAAAFADTVSNNYATCHDNAAKLTALQDWARSLQGGTE